MNKEKVLELKVLLLEEINKQQKEQIKYLKTTNIILSILSSVLILGTLILRSN